mmetsp:Transcript_14093/g.29735  ORF Transcript_14093/g.29735 Transcript_14093/m.29735 type:complete len:107 (+) Transcript_14093:159-479(+)
MRFPAQRSGDATNEVKGDPVTQYVPAWDSCDALDFIDSDLVLLVPRKDSGSWDCKEVPKEDKSLNEARQAGADLARGSRSGNSVHVASMRESRLDGTEVNDLERWC